MPLLSDATLKYGLKDVDAGKYGLKDIAAGGGVRPEELDYLVPDSYTGGGTNGATALFYGIDLEMTADTRIWSLRWKSNTTAAVTHIIRLFDVVSEEILGSVGPILVGGDNKSIFQEEDLDSPVDLVIGQRVALIAESSGAFDWYWASAPGPYTSGPITDPKMRFGDVQFPPIKTGSFVGWGDMGYELL